MPPASPNRLPGQRNTSGQFWSGNGEPLLFWTGVEKSDRPDKASSLETFLSLFRVVDFGEEDARHYAQIRADLERKGTQIGPLDLVIAAHARNLGPTLITRNAAEFKRVKGLKVQAWK